MNGINTTYLFAALLLIAGILGFIAAAESGNALFRLGGAILIAFSLAVFIGETIGQVRHKRDQPRDSD